MPHLLWLILISIVILIFAAIFVYFRTRKKRSMDALGALRFRKLVFHEYGSTAEESAYELIKTETWLRISNYFGNWWDDGEGEHSRINCLAKRRRGSIELYNELAKEFGRLDIASWNGFDARDPNVCDGEGFWFALELESGEFINACGMNSFPPNYREFIEILHGLFANKDSI